MSDRPALCEQCDARPILEHVAWRPGEKRLCRDCHAELRTDERKRDDAPATNPKRTRLNG